MKALALAILSAIALSQVPPDIEGAARWKIWNQGQGAVVQVGWGTGGQRGVEAFGLSVGQAKVVETAMVEISPGVFVAVRVEVELVEAPEQPAPDGGRP